MPVREVLALLLTIIILFAVIFFFLSTIMFVIQKLCCIKGDVIELTVNKVCDTEVLWSILCNSMGFFFF